MTRYGHRLPDPVNTAAIDRAADGPRADRTARVEWEDDSELWAVLDRFQTIALELAEREGDR